MGTGSSGAATMRHMGLVALEASLVETIVWVAAMTLAGATGTGGLVGDANAGRTTGSLAAGAARLAATVTVTADSAENGMWVHAICTQGPTVVLSSWARIDARHHASVPLARSSLWRSGDATCTVDEGYFSTNGRWWVSTTTFGVQG